MVNSIKRKSTISRRLATQRKHEAQPARTHKQWWQATSFFCAVLLLQLPLVQQLVKLMHPNDPSTTQSAISDLQWLPAQSRNASHTSPVQVKRSAAPGPKPYAFMWLIGSIMEDSHTYKGFLYDVMISVYLLKERLNAQDSDFWLFAQLSSQSRLEALPEDVQGLLDEMGIKVRMIEKPRAESFAQVVYEKFRALELTQYRRVIFLDADTIPLVNLEYIFHLSDPLHHSTPTILRPNLIMATRGEPCNTGFFMVEPKEGRWELVQSIIDRNREIGKTLPYPHFNFYDGWGHNFRRSGDHWESLVEKNGLGWRFHAGHSDQGLMYFYARFAVKDVSIVIGDTVQNWYTSDGWFDDKAQMQENMPNGLDPYFPGPPLEYEFNCHRQGLGQDPNHSFRCVPIFQGFAHFMGKDKPWQKGGRVPDAPSDAKPMQSATNRLWYDTLETLNKNLGLGLDIQNWAEKHGEIMKESPLGYLAYYTDNANHVFNKTIGDPSSNETEVLSNSDKPASNMPTRNSAVLNGQEVYLNPFSKKFLDPRASLRPPPGKLYTKREEAPSTIAYAVSFIKCGDFQTHSAGLTDASLILRHSIHKVSSRTPDSGSVYDYKMYAIVHRDAKECSQALTETGFEVIVVDPPVTREEIQGDELRRLIPNEWCCGEAEFVKLFAYTIEEEVIVHVDIDFAFFKPMDDLFDSMLFDKDSEIGRTARSRLLLERPDDVLPDKIGAFLTRDWPQVAPGKFPPGYQAGFLVARRDPSALEEMIDIVKEGNFTPGWGMTSGWSGSGHGGYVGAMAMQGLVAYYYDHVRLNNAVELNQCRFNHMGMDVLYRKHPNFRRNLPGVGGCRNAQTSCEECMNTAFDKIFSVHYTMCRKPWQCQARGLPGGKEPGGARATHINTDTVNLDHCMELVRAWHSLRSDFEDSLYQLTGDESIKAGKVGDYRPDVFQGHCSGDGNKDYIVIQGSRESMARVTELYNV